MNDFISMFVIVDRFSKYVVFIPILHSCLADVVAELFVKHVVPKDIVSDRDTRFTGRFYVVFFDC